MTQKEPEQYPQDRFDDVEPYTSQQGAHRKVFAAPKGAGQLNATIIAGGVALAIGVGAFLWLSPLDPLNMANEPSANVTNTPVEDEPQDDESDELLEEPEPSSTPADETELGPEQPETSEPVEEPETGQEDESTEPEVPELPTPEETPTPETPEATVDYSQSIGVYNASNIQGYAADVAQNLRNVGYNVPVAANWTGNTPGQTTVYFSGDETTAVAVAQQVGGIAVYEPSVDGVLVVLTGG